MTDKPALFEQLDKEMKEANLTPEGEPKNDENTGKARDRIATRRDARKSGASPQDESPAPQEDDGASRGSERKPPGDEQGTPKDDAAPSGDALAPSGSAEAGDVLEGKAEKTLSPKEEAYHRRKQRESEAKIKELEEKLAQFNRPVEKPVEKPAEPVKADQSHADWRTANAEPDRDKDLAGWLVWNAEDQRKWREEQTTNHTKGEEQRKLDTLVQGAYQEIKDIRANYAKTNPDFDNAYNYGKSQYAASVKRLMPQYSDAQIDQLFDKEILAIGLKCNKEGSNLGDVLYDMAIERFGYEPGAEAKPSLKPNLRVVANNKRKSASPLNSGGEGAKARITVEQAANMTPEEMLDLDASDWEYLRSQGLA